MDRAKAQRSLYASRGHKHAVPCWQRRAHVLGVSGTAAESLQNPSTEM